MMRRGVFNVDAVFGNRYNFREAMANLTLYYFLLTRALIKEGTV